METCSPEEPKSSKGNENRCAWITMGATFLFLICVMVQVFFITRPQEQQQQINTDDNTAAGVSLQGASIAYLAHALNKAKICKPETCGIGAQCEKGLRGTIKCACLPGYVRNPDKKCVKPECIANYECQSDQACHNQRCVDPCQNACAGNNAKCEVSDHIPVCSCPKGYTGNPALHDCEEIEPDNDLQTDAPDMTEASVNTEGPSEEEKSEKDPCNPSPCGPNATCSLIQNKALCYYQQDGSSMLTSTELNRTKQHECESDDDCDFQEACREYKCVSPCSDCAKYTICKKSDHRAICTCRRGFSGDPRIKCSPECEEDKDCPSKAPLCVEYACVDPCHGACGINAQCRYNHKEDSIVCSCGPLTTGDPRVFCRPTDHSKGNFCDPNPCGANATCTLSGDTSDNSTVEQQEYPHCSCPSGHVGHPRISCELPECEEDFHCTEDRACFEYQCVDPCVYDGNACGYGAICSTSDHLQTCTCKEGKYGDPFSGCCSEDLIWFPAVSSCRKIDDRHWTLDATGLKQMAQQLMEQMKLLL